MQAGLKSGTHRVNKTLVVFVCHTHPRVRRELVDGAAGLTEGLTAGLIAGLIAG